MALSIAQPTNSGSNVPVSSGYGRTAYPNLVGDAGYPTGGYPITAATVGLGRIDQVAVGLSVAGAHLAVYDAVNSKIKVFTAPGAEVGNGVSLAGILFPAVIVGV